MTVRRLFSLLLVPALLAGLASSIGAGEPSPGPEDADLFKGKSVNMYFYQNNYFGFGMAIPADWHAAVGEELRQVLMQCSRRNPSIKLLTEGNNRALLSISKHPPVTSPNNCNILVLAHDFSQEMPSGKTAKDLLTNIEFVARQSGEKVIKGVHPAPLDGQEFYRLDIFSPRSGQLRSEVVKDMKGYFLRFLMTCWKESQMNELDKILNSVDFQ